MYLHICFTTICSILFLFILTKLMGCHQMSEMTMFDYINGITIGSIAAEMATSLEQDIRIPLLAMGIYAAASLLFSFLSQKSLLFRRILNGTSLILLSKDKIYRDNLKQAGMELSEFLLQCRNKGFFDLRQIDTAILEPNGTLSILPKTEHRPLTPADLSLTPVKDEIYANLIIDGKLMKENLRHIGKNETWLNDQLKIYGISDWKQVFLAVCSKTGDLQLYPNLPGKNKTDLLD